MKRSVIANSYPLEKPTKSPFSDVIVSNLFFVNFSTAVSMLSDEIIVRKAFFVSCPARLLPGVDGSDAILLENKTKNKEILDFVLEKRRENSIFSNCHSKCKTTSNFDEIC